MGGQPAAGTGRRETGRETAAFRERTAASTARPQRAGQTQETGRPRFRGESQYEERRKPEGQARPSGRQVYQGERQRGGKPSYNREARFRKMARKRKKRRQHILAASLIGLILLICGTVFGIACWRDKKEQKAFALAGAEAAATGDYKAAAEAFDRALKPGGHIGKFETDVLLNRAEAEYRQGLYGQALETYRLLLEEDKDCQLFQEGAALCLMELGNYEEALSMGVLQGQIYNRMAVDQIEAGQYEEALASIALGRGFADLLAEQDLSFNEAVAYERMADYKKALELFEAYAGRYGDDQRARRELTFLRTRQGNNGQ